MQKINDILSHPKSKEIEQRLKIIEFFDEYGPEATRKAFGKSRSTIYLRKQKLKNSGDQLSSLAPGNKAPKSRRKRKYNSFIEGSIMDYRTRHPDVDKVTITPVLKAAFEAKGIKPPSESTVGRIIGDLKKQGRLPKGAKERLSPKATGRAGGNRYCGYLCRWSQAVSDYRY